MYCRHCGTQMNDNQAICIKCGVKVGEGNKYCSNCGKETSENADVCLNCGVAIKKSSGDLGGQSKTTMALICFFLGFVGIHNFMMGETKKGIFKIITFFFCGIAFVFTLIDLIKILTDKYVIEPNKFI